ncbi:hypothetical protein DPMN_144611 [Dreissena polymorpha]|uniref:Uncharacterized protein n=1 Tax=Dreissena polymorpha TaxID=45954 RepID=A0A9D4F4D2_DREPO|nr:hypothetical protein DPMN_144611 [Dreissena polymorpha]
MLQTQVTARFEDYVPMESRTNVENAILENFKTVPCIVNNTCESNITISDVSDLISNKGRNRRGAQSSISVLLIIPLPDANELDMAGFIENRTGEDLYLKTST